MAQITYTRRDDDIRNDVFFELKWDPKIDSSDIAVAVKDGVVTLSGFASTYWDKLEAEKAAKRVYGVRAVANDIEVKPILKRTDPEIARDVVQALEGHVSIPGDQIKVTVKNGVVTLEGALDWQFQKALADSAVKKVKGVTGIINDIEVKPRVSPTEIKGKIEEALRRSAELDARRITVDAEGGTVSFMAACVPGPRKRRPSAPPGRRRGPLKSKTTS
jgi:osmotically-inducible protein OsmY